MTKKMVDKDRVTKELLNLSIDNQRIGFSVRVINILESAGILTLKDLMNWSIDELRLLRNFGDASRGEVRNVLSQMGLRLKDDYPLEVHGDTCPFCGQKIQRKIP